MSLSSILLDNIGDKFEGQDNFLDRLPLIIDMMKFNLGVLEDESLIWGQPGDARDLLKLEWIEHVYFIEYKAKYQEAYILLVNLNNKISGMYEVPQTEISYAMLALMRAISIGVPPGGLLYGDSFPSLYGAEGGHSNGYTLDLLGSSSIVEEVISNRKSLWEQRGWTHAVVDLTMSDDGEGMKRPKKRPKKRPRKRPKKKSRKHKSRKHKSRKHKSRKRKSRKRKSRH